MARIRLINPGNLEGPRVSWIIIPIVMEDIVQAYFVVMESREFIDYYDEFAIRIGIMIQLTRGPSKLPGLIRRILDILM